MSITDLHLVHSTKSTSKEDLRDMPMYNMISYEDMFVMRVPSGWHIVLYIDTGDTYKIKKLFVKYPLISRLYYNLPILFKQILPKLPWLH